MKNIFKLLLIFVSCTSLKAQTVGFRDESKTDEAFYQTITEFSKLKPGDDWKKFFSDSVYYVQASDGQKLDFIIHSKAHLILFKV